MFSNSVDFLCWSVSNKRPFDIHMTFGSDHITGFLYTIKSQWTSTCVINWLSICRFTYPQREPLLKCIQSFELDKFEQKFVQLLWQTKATFQFKYVLTFYIFFTAVLQNSVLNNDFILNKYYEVSLICF